MLSSGSSERNSALELESSLQCFSDWYSENLFNFEEKTIANNIKNMKLSAKEFHVSILKRQMYDHMQQAYNTKLFFIVFSTEL